MLQELINNASCLQNYPKSNGLVAPMNRALSLPQSLSPLPTNAGSMTGIELNNRVDKNFKKTTTGCTIYIFNEIAAVK